MFRALINPLLSVLLVALLVLNSWGIGAWPLLFALNLSVIALFANGALALARVLTARPFTATACWSIVYLGLAGTLISGAMDKSTSKNDTNHSFNRDSWALDSVAALEDYEELYLLLEDVAKGKEFAPPLDAQWAVLAAHVAIEHEQQTALQRLLQAGVSPNACFEGEPLLIPAIYKENMSIIRTLLKAGAKPNYALAGGDGSTPLMSAAMNGNKDIINLLLQAGGDPYQRNNNGSCAIDLAPNQIIKKTLQQN